MAALTLPASQHATLKKLGTGQATILNVQPLYVQCHVCAHVHVYHLYSNIMQI